MLEGMTLFNNMDEEVNPSAPAMYDYSEAPSYVGTERKFSGGLEASESTKRARNCEPAGSVNQEVRTMKIAGIPVEFPPGIKPHPPQIALCAKMVSALANSKHALLERCAFHSSSLRTSLE